ncbi:hypothetical protein PHLGIDRAFT_369817 [Phlebiopsis gigantea 11061_1 CR5-6]|uniref:Secreted protein n=1 Tax=Phlebiopsis gigantea (strain 11061_1 CR5-6) TaxID=745531 RepID=A0A0C3P2J9_PHLG1|nr:hypothetical protein PHLGIDRAFT_369817 [Phlebiopsis gigantea 11061_1 CR5-6]
MRYALTWCLFICAGVLTCRHRSSLRQNELRQRLFRQNTCAINAMHGCTWKGSESCASLVSGPVVCISAIRFETGFCGLYEQILHPSLNVST